MARGSTSFSRSWKSAGVTEWNGEPRAGHGRGANLVIIYYYSGLYLYHRWDRDWRFFFFAEGLSI